jgi:hypothetical protein
MTINIENLAVIEDVLNPDDQFAAEIDIATWLSSDTISSVAYTAVDGSGENSASDVLDGDKHSNTNTVIKPYIKGGVTDNRYTVKCLVTTSGGDKKAFYLKWECKEYSA